MNLNEIIEKQRELITKLEGFLAWRAETISQYHKIVIARDIKFHRLLVVTRSLVKAMDNGLALDTTKLKKVLDKLEEKYE